MTTNKICQPVYKAIHEAIAGLGNELAVEVLEEISGHVESMIEGIEEEESEDKS